MFSVKALGQNNPNYRVILSGVTFGFFDRSLFFEVLSDGIATPVKIEFIVRIDETKKPLTFEMSPIKDGQKTLVFLNPSALGPSGLIQPVGILQRNPNHILGFMFTLDRLGESKTYRLSYEFSDGLIGETGKEAAS